MKLNIFNDANGTWSWRKFITCVILFLYVIIVYKYESYNDWKELPLSYMIVIYLVILFYFFRRAIDKILSKYAKN